METIIILVIALIVMQLILIITINQSKRELLREIQNEKLITGTKLEIYESIMGNRAFSIQPALREFITAFIENPANFTSDEYSFIYAGKDKPKMSIWIANGKWAYRFEDKEHPMFNDIEKNLVDYIYKIHLKNNELWKQKLENLLSYYGQNIKK